MGSTPGAFALLSAAGFGSAAGSLVMGVLYAIMFETTLSAMSLLFVGPAVVAGLLGNAGARWAVRRDRERWLRQTASSGPVSARIVEDMRR